MTETPDTEDRASLETELANLEKRRDELESSLDEEVDDVRDSGDSAERLEEQDELSRLNDLIETLRTKLNGE
jgi:uncharacterized protein YhaN